MDCAEGEVVDGDACVPAACGTGPWGDVEADVYADGSVPLADLVAAYPDARIALAAGAWDAGLSLGRTNDGLALVGRCKELVTLTGDEGALLALDGRATVTVAGLTLRGGLTALEAVRGDLVVSDVDIVGALGFGILAVGDGVTVALTDVSITDTQPVDGRYGRAIDVESGVELTAERLHLARNVDVSLFAVDYVTVDLDTVVIEDTLPAGPRVGGRGVEIGAGSRLTATELTVDRSSDVGIFGYGADTAITVTNTTIRDTSSSDPAVGAAGIQVNQGATLSFRGGTVARSEGPGIVGDGAGTTIAVEDARIDENRSGVAAVSAGGLAVQSGATATIRHSSLTGNESIALGSSDAGSVLVAEDVVITSTRTGPDGHGGEALFADASTLIATDITVQDGQEHAVYARAGGVVEIDGLTVDGTWTTEDADYGRGINVQEGAFVTCAGCTLTDSHDVGVFADGVDTRAVLIDSAINTTQSAAHTRGGIGVNAQSGAQISGENLTVQGTDGPGVYLVTAGSFACAGCTIADNGFAGVVVLDAALTLTDTVVTGSRGDGSSGGGVGVYAAGAYGPPTVSLERVSLSGNRYAAVWLAGEGAYRIVDSVLEGGSGVELIGNTVHGNAVYAADGVTAWTGTSGLSLTGSRLTGSRTAVLLQAASAALDGASFDGNDLDLQQQVCPEVAAPTGLDQAVTTVICPERWQLVAPLWYGLYVEDIAAKP